MTRVGARRRPVVIGEDDPSVTGRAGLVLVAEVDRVLGVAEAFESSVGWLKARSRGLGIGEVLVSMAESMLADGDLMCDLDHLRADRAGSALRAVAEAPAASTFVLAARRLDDRAVERIEAGMGTLIGRWFGLMPEGRRFQLVACRPTIDLDGTDVEVYGRKKERVAWNHEGRRVGRPHPATWAEAGVVLAADLGSGADDPRPAAPALIARAVANLPAGLARPRVRADAGCPAPKQPSATTCQAGGRRGPAPWFRERAWIEERHRDSKLGYALVHLPSGRWRVNQAWMWSAYLATNLSIFAQTLGRVDADGVRAQAKRARRQLFCLPARVLSHARRIILRFAAGVAEVAFRTAWQNLRSLPPPAPAEHPPQRPAAATRRPGRNPLTAPALAPPAPTSANRPSPHLHSESQAQVTTDGPESTPPQPYLRIWV